MQPIQMRLVAYDLNTMVGVVTNLTEVSLYIPANDDPVLRFKYTEARGLASQIARNEWDIAVQFSFGNGLWTEPPNCRFILVDEAGDDSALEASIEATAVGASFDLHSAVTLNAALLDDQGRRRFTNATPGEYLRSYILAAQSANVCTALTVDFTDALDSSTAAWIHGVSMDIFGHVSAHEVLESLTNQGLCDWRFQGNSLQLYNEIPSSSTAQLVLGREVATRHEDRTSRELADIVAVVADEGLFKVSHSGRGPRKRGLRARAMSQGGVSQEATLNLLAASALEAGAVTKQQVTRDLRLAPGVQFLPFRDYLPGHFIQTTAADTTTGALEEMRVQAITIEADQHGFLKGSVTLNDRLLDRTVRQSKRIEGIVGGSTIAGGTNAQPLPPPPDLPDVTLATPATPTGLGLDWVVATLTAGSYPQATITANWSDVTASTAGDPMMIADYEVVVLKGGATVATSRSQDSSASIGGLATSATYTVRVRAVSMEGKPGGWASQTVTVGADTTPPPPPSTPIISSQYGVIRVTWDGKTDAGGEMPVDFSHVEVRVVGEAPILGRIATLGGGSVVTPREPGSSLTVQLVAVDSSGNVSAPSSTATEVVHSIFDDPTITVDIEDMVAAREIRAEDVIAGEISGWVIEGSEFRSQNPHTTDLDNIIISGGDVRTRKIFDDPWVPGEVIDQSTHLVSGSVTMRTNYTGADRSFYGQLNASGLFLETPAAPNEGDPAPLPRQDAQVSPGYVAVASRTGAIPVGGDANAIQYLGPNMTLTPGGLYGFDNQADGSRPTVDLSIMSGLQYDAWPPDGQPPVFTYYEWDQIWTSQPFTITSQSSLELANSGGSIELRSGGQFYVSTPYVDISTPTTSFLMGASFVLNTDNLFNVTARSMGLTTQQSVSLTAGSNINLNTGGTIGTVTVTRTTGTGRLQINDAPTTTAAANAHISAAGSVLGLFYRSTSVRAAKAEIRDLPFDTDDYLALQPRDWIDRAALEADQVGDTDGGVSPLTRIPGLVAEEVAESGNEWLVQRDEVGELTNVSYDRGWVPLVPIVRELRERIMQLEAQHA